MSCLDPHPFCAHYKRTERIWFEDFLRGGFVGTWTSLCPSNAISLIEGFQIRKELCVSCLLCAAFCPNKSIAFDDTFGAYVKEQHQGRDCITAVLDRQGRRAIKSPTDLIAGTPAELIEGIDRLDSSFLKRSLRKFVMHFSSDFDSLVRWGTNALYFITLDDNPKIANSVKIRGAKREIRVEACHSFSNNIALWKFDNQIDFKFVDRFLFGRDAANEIVKSSGKLYKQVFGCYLLGQDEDEYFKSSSFNEAIVDRLRDYKLTMVSALALWCLVARKLFLARKISLESLLQEVEDNNDRYLIMSDDKCLKLIEECSA